MRSRSAILGALAVALVAGLLTPIASPRAKSGDQCQIRGRVITADSVAVIYRRGPSRSYAIFSCVQKTGRTQELGTFDGDVGGKSGFNLAEKYVGYIRSLCSREGPCAGRPHVRNVVSNEERTASRTPGNAVDVRPLAFPSGAIAWVRGTLNSPKNEIRVLGADGEERVLDSGNSIGLNSLARAGHTLYWLHGGEPRAAQVP
ncbi:MAG TPA: hypothetical protein VJT75_02525 [Thermoleophilaceae bacterium]|nr:hypothetical protein [Thermoleophilaceae bacterium]